MLVTLLFLVLLTGSASAFPYPTQCGRTHLTFNVVTLILDYHQSYQCDHHPRDQPHHEFYHPPHRDHPSQA